MNNGDNFPLHQKVLTPFGGGVGEPFSESPISPLEAKLRRGYWGKRFPHIETQVIEKQTCDSDCRSQLRFLWLPKRWGFANLFSSDYLKLIF